MRRFVLTALIAVVASAYFAASAGAIPRATLSCRKSGSDATPAAAPMQLAQPSGGGTHLTYELENVMISS